MSVVIHITGASGAGKTFLGKRLSEQFGPAIVVEDIDDLRRDFIKEHYGLKKFKVINKTAYQKYIDVFFTKHASKPLVFVGLNNMPWWHPDHYYNMHATHKYFIDLDDETILRQKCRRLLLKRANSIEYIHNLQKDIAGYCNLKNTVARNRKWKHDYTDQQYVLMSRDDIFQTAGQIIMRSLGTI